MLNVALIGMGNIGLLFDTDKNTKTALSHIKALYLHKDFNLKYLVDIDDKHLKTVKEFFPDIKFSTNYKDIVKNNDIDIVTVATPTNTHFSILNDFQSNKNIKLFFMEKPLFNTKDEYSNISQNIQQKKQKIQKNKYGNLQKIVINYCKGIKNNGSHMIDMVNFLFDNPTIISSKILSHTTGFNKLDLTYDIFIEIEYENNIIPLYFLGLDHTLYNIIEHNLYFENKIVKYINSKSAIEYYDIIPDKNFRQYKVTSHTPKTKKVKTTTLMIKAYDELYNIINSNKNNISSYDDELANIKFLSHILKGIN